jgi:hypothetical protein
VEYSLYRPLPYTGPETQCANVACFDLGFREYVYTLADDTKSFAYRDWYKAGLNDTPYTWSEFPNLFNQATSRARRINFSLDRILETGGGVEEAVRLGGEKGWRGLVTHKELFEIYTKPELFNKTRFYYQGRPVSPLFRPTGP